MSDRRGVGPDEELRALARRIVAAADRLEGPFTPARRARLLLAARQLIEECPPAERATWLRAFLVRGE